jgi:anti-sigma regulatory factor (Ser/Thr protein kinase)
MPSDSRQQRIIANRLSEMVEVERWIAGLAVDWALPERTAFAVDLVVNEAVTNIISYAFADDASHPIRISLTNGAESVTVEIEDGGLAFNPLAAPSRVEASDLEHASIGGRGIHLIKAYSDEQHYAYISGSNRLRLVVSKPT